MKKVMMGVALLALSVGLVGCGERVQPGEVGIKVRSLGSSAGVDKTPLSVGWHGTGLGEDIKTFPVISKQYAFSKAPGDGGQANEEIQFADKNGALITADVQISLQVMPNMAPSLWQARQLTFDDLLVGPIRNDIRSAISAETEKVGVEDLIGSGRQTVIINALQTVQKKWRPLGVEITDLQWLGSPRYPQSMMDSILARTKADQEVARAKAEQAVAEAEAGKKIAIAKGDAEATRIRGEALRANPQVLEQMKIEKWDGKLPTVTGGATPFVNIN